MWVLKIFHDQRYEKEVPYYLNVIQLNEKGQFCEKQTNQYLLGSISGQISSFPLQ